MTIRKARIEDAKGIVETHYDAIHNITKTHYNKTIRNAWHSGVTQAKIEKTKKIIKNSDEEIFVCTNNGKVIGFGSLVPSHNELRAIYVHSNYGRKGIATKLLQTLEKRASTLKLPRIQLHSSLTAQDFYQKQGYKILHKGIHTLSNGTKMDSVLMEKHFTSIPKLKPVTKDSLQSCFHFLEKRKESCLFLLGNLTNYGFKIGKHINSGNYYLLKRNHKIVGVFTLTRRGVLLIQTDGKDNYSQEICKAILKENIKLKGIIGPWKDCFLFKIHYEFLNNGWAATSISKEQLYFLKLSDVKHKNMFLKPGLPIKFLTETNFKEWDVLNHKYLKEVNLPVEGSIKKRKQIFKEAVKNKNIWGLFLNKKLISIGAYNTKYKDIGQMGGVFTIPEQRGKGYSTLCMKQIIPDSKKVHQLNSLILFTGEKNIPAQKLYKSLGFKQLGDFGLIFGSQSRQEKGPGSQS